MNRFRQRYNELAQELLEIDGLIREAINRIDAKEYNRLIRRKKIIPFIMEYCERMEEKHPEIYTFNHLMTDKENARYQNQIAKLRDLYGAKTIPMQVHKVVRNVGW